VTPVSDFASVLTDMQRRIILLEEHAQLGLIDRGELRRETAVLREQVDQLRRISDEAGDEHVTRTEFAPVRTITFGAVGAILPVRPVFAVDAVAARCASTSSFAATALDPT
jgi:hypothetical protein